MSADRPRFHFTVDKYHRLIDVGILTENDSVELICGAVVQTIMPASDQHGICVDRINAVLKRLGRDQVTVNVHHRVTLSDSVPEPDVALVTARPELIATRGRAADVKLLVEVADRSFDVDRDVKAPLYAENGIPEYWIVNLNDDTVHVYRGPRTDGTWAAHQQLARGDTLTVAALPGVLVAVADVLP
jgi:Uma2 family endonuclease